jgi:hypothetical protein
MFNSAVIDTAIGVVFVYLLLSLICSAVGEAIESIMRNRAADLERGIKELVTDEKTTGGLKGFLLRVPWLRTFIPWVAGFFGHSDATQTPASDADPQLQNYVAKLYDHPLLNGLYRGTYEEAVKYRSKGLFKRLFGWIWQSTPKLPTYIPSRNFALALLDIALPASQTNASGAAGALADANAPLSSPPGGSVEALRQAILDNLHIDPASKLGKALLPLIDSAGNDVNLVRQNIENWFDSAMDRASGWYKRRTQFVIFAIGLIVAITVNADTVYIVKKLFNDKELRETVAASAIEYAKANANVSPTPTPGPSPSPSPSPSPNSSPGPPPSPSPSAMPDDGSAAIEACWNSASECSDKDPEKDKLKKASLACRVKQNECSAKACFAAECTNQNSPRCKAAMSRCQLDALGLPIGWPGNGDITMTWPAWHFSEPGGWWTQFYWHGIGWLLTALAISLGAPFWFDMLNKLIVVRSTVKPKEKSQDEPSKS